MAGPQPINRSQLRNSHHSRGLSFGRGWEEAGAEFYQEDFHQGTLSSAGDHEEDTWKEQLPSKQVNRIGK